MSEEQKDEKKDQSVRDLTAKKDVTGGAVTPGTGPLVADDKGTIKLGGQSGIDPTIGPPIVDPPTKPK